MVNPTLVLLTSLVLGNRWNKSKNFINVLPIKSNSIVLDNQQIPDHLSIYRIF